MQVSPGGMSDKFAQKIAVTVAGALGIATNYLVAGPEIGNVSRQNPTWLTPDGITFAIWAPIFALILVLVISQWCPDYETEMLLSQRCPLTKLEVRWRIALYLLMNALWPPVFAQSWFFTSFLIICVYLSGLISVMTVLNTKSVSRVCPWIQFVASNVIHASWVTTATALNLFLLLGSLGSKDQFGVAGTPLAAMAAIAALVVIAFAMAICRLEFLWSMVTAWATAGIAKMQLVADAASAAPLNSNLADFAMWSTAAALIASAIGLLLFTCDICKPANQGHELLVVA